jgi:aryl-alcohol dehydrogenase-like predicted oxidoreductase
MKYRKFGEVSVSEIGLGTWQLGADWSEVPEEEAMKILATFVNEGGNFLDTADVYGMGISERTLGKFLKSTDQQLYVATKLGRRHDEGNGWPVNFEFEHMRAHVNSSLANLELGQLFLEQLHCIPKTELEQGKVFDNFRQLQQQGLIRHWGASVETVEEGMICLKQDGLASLQIIFNIFRQTAADELLHAAAEKNVAIIVRLPLASGLLTGKFTNNTTFAATDHRNYNANGDAFNVGETFAGLKLADGVDFANQIQTLLPPGKMADWALRWILDHPEVTTIIPGASKVQQVEENMRASDLAPLPAAVHEHLKSMYENDIKPLVRGEI